MHLTLPAHHVRSYKLPQHKAASSLLRGALVRLKLDKLLGHVIVVALREDAQHGQSGLVHADALAQRQPAGHAAPRCHILQLQHGHAHRAVLACKAVVLHAEVQLVAIQARLTAQGATDRRGSMRV
ncbi:hypothetical protein AALO_G00124180 [Alosa alosa]|uniref:Uncharacterized protein n=1 Tax=Alosa alosa TaxID=278164 RepID=A0AAV6GKL5_9TELE|nr:hypothetical protein AALO_G00124180 [Alosa alosa]